MFHSHVIWRSARVFLVSHCYISITNQASSSSFEEAECVAKLVIGTFRGAGQEETGLYDHRFVQVQATSCLPFRVHLRKLQLNYPDDVWWENFWMKEYSPAVKLELFIAVNLRL